MMFLRMMTLKMIQRFTGDPINVPTRFFDNLNFAIFQEVVESEGKGIVRRITGVDEIIGYNKIADGGGDFILLPFFRQILFIKHPPF